jgi:EAL domain-containing protein (putative c-di-GMP-specific phosphodiesterase class I)
MRAEQALGRQEFVLYYQPKVNMRQGRVVGAEALIRWQHPEEGLLAPGRFLPQLDNTDLVVPLGEWVIGQALHQMQQWASQGLQLPVSVNIAGDHLERPDFVERLQTLLARFPQVDPHHLELEILETTAVNNLERVVATMQGCAALGVRFALDDFGTGYSSLTYFRRLPAQVLKIDQSFVRDMLEDHEDLAIVTGVVSLATTFEREVIAEGLETVAHGVKLLELGCSMAQGYGIAKPMPADQLASWIQTWQAPVSWLEYPGPNVVS